MTLLYISEKYSGENDFIFYPKYTTLPKFLFSPILLNCLSFSLYKTNQSTVYWRFTLSLLNKFSHAIIFNVSQNHQFLPPHWNSPISLHIYCHIFHLNKKWVFSLAHIVLERLPHLFIPFPARAYTFLAPIFLIIHSSKPFIPSHQWNHSCHSHQHAPSCLIQMWIQSPLLTWPLSSIWPRWHSPSWSIYLLGHHTLSGVYTYITDHFFIFYL